jgi:hypothetical protein
VESFVDRLCISTGRRGSVKRFCRRYHFPIGHASCGIHVFTFVKQPHSRQRMPVWCGQAAQVSRRCWKVAAPAVLLPALADCVVACTALRAARKPAEAAPGLTAVATPADLVAIRSTVKIQIDTIYMGIICIGLIALVMDRCLRAIAERAVRWQERITA